MTRFPSILLHAFSRCVTAACACGVLLAGPARAADAPSRVLAVSQKSGTAANLMGVQFRDPGSGWAVGAGGIILKTGDGGKRWKAVASGTTTLLTGVFFADLRQGWAVGANGTILHSSDGGEKWKAQQSGTQSALYGVFFLTPSAGWAVGAGGTILHTNDGCAHWEDQVSGTNAILYAVHFADPLHGGAVGADVEARLGLELLGEVLDDGVVHVGAAELCVARSALDLEDAAAHLHYRDVQGAAAKVKDHYLQVPVGLVKAVGKRRRGGFVDYPDNLQACNLACVLCGLALVVVEISRNSDNRLRDRLTSRPTLGSVPRSPGDLASRLRGEADYRVTGSVREAYWGARGTARDALREGAREAWRDSLSGSAGGVQASMAALEDGPAFSETALNRLEPAQVAELIEAYDALKLYLVLTDPETHPEAAFVQEALPRAWRRLAEADARVPDGERRIRDNAALYAAYLEAGKAPALSRDKRLVDQARVDLKAFLVETSPAAREYLRLRLAAEAQYPALTLADILPEASRPLMYAGEAVPAFFTQRVWQEFVLPELTRTLASDLQVERDWVLEGESELDEVQGKAQFAREVLARYKLEYIFAWERFLADVGVRRFAGLDASRERLTQLSDYQRSPLKLLLQVVDANTRWDHPDAARRQVEEAAEEAPEESRSSGWWQRTRAWLRGADQVGERALALTEMPPMHDGILASHFEPVEQLFSAALGAEGDASQMERYLLLLRQLKVRLDRLERGDVGKRTKQLMEDVVEGRPNEITALHNYVAANIDTSRDELVQSLQRLFRDPVEFAVASLDGPIATQLAAAWGDQIATPWNSMVGGRFPVSDSSNEASVRDLRQFVDPQSGLLTAFDQDEVGSLGEASNGDGEPLVDPRITSTIAQGTGVGRVLESLADVENGFEIMIEPSSTLTSIRLTLDGQEQAYRMGPQSWQRFTWPGEARQAGARLEVVTHGGQRITVFDYPSRWGLLRLVDSASVTDLDGVRQRFTWHTSVGSVSFIVRNFGGVKLTDLEQVRRLRIPAVGAR